MSKSARYLEVSGLSCQRGSHLVFSNLAFGLAPGDALVLTGANGAGKTSLLMCLAGIVPYLTGAISWPGRDASIRPGADLHVIAHASALKPALTVSENLRFWADLNGGDRRRVAAALETAGIAHAENLEAGLLSSGQIRRLALARLLVAHRPVWLLDEPTTALDRNGSRWVAGLIEAHLDAGGMVVAATHLDIGLKPSPRVTTLTLGAPG